MFLSGRNVDKISRSQDNRILPHTDAKAAGEDSVNFVDRMRVFGEERAGRICIARDAIAKLLQLAAHRRLREDAVLLLMPVFHSHWRNFSLIDVCWCCRSQAAAGF